MQHRFDERGQVLLVTLLVLSIATTIALSVIGRTTTDLQISNETEESARAFSAAEAGIEEALRSGISSGTQVLTDTGVSYDATVTTIGAAAGPYLLATKTDNNASEDIWLVDHNADGTLNEVPTYTSDTLVVCWENGSTIPALAVKVFYKTGAEYRVAHLALDPDAGRAASNNFTIIGGAGTACGRANMFSHTISLSSLGINPVVDTVLSIRLRPLYASSLLGVDSGGEVLPSQGDRIESVGSTATGLTRKIIVHRPYKTTASIFDSAVVSQSTFLR